MKVWISASATDSLDAATKSATAFTAFVAEQFPSFWTHTAASKSLGGDVTVELASISPDKAPHGIVRNAKLYMKILVSLSDNGGDRRDDGLCRVKPLVMSAPRGLRMPAENKNADPAKAFDSMKKWLLKNKDQLQDLEAKS